MRMPKTRFMLLFDRLKMNEISKFVDVGKESDKTEYTRE